MEEDERTHKRIRYITETRTQGKRERGVYRGRLRLRLRLREDAGRQSESEQSIPERQVRVPFRCHLSPFALLGTQGSGVHAAWNTTGRSSPSSCRTATDQRATCSHGTANAGSPARGHERLHDARPKPAQVAPATVAFEQLMLGGAAGTEACLTPQACQNWIGFRSNRCAKPANVD